MDCIVGPVERIEEVRVEIAKQFARDESGATAIEYGLIAALISVAVIAGVRAIGTKLSATFDGISQNLS